MVTLYNDKIKQLSKQDENNRCVDCGISSPQWTSVTYGIFICLDCASIHRSFGTKISFVKSVTMDSWNHREYLSMKYGTNKKFKMFLEKNGLFHKESNEIYHNNPIRKYANELKEMVNKELGVKEDTGGSSNNTPHEYYGKVKLTNTVEETYDKSPKMSANGSVQSKINNTLCFVGNTILTGMKEIGVKTKKYGESLTKNVIIPAAKAIKSKTNDFYGSSKKKNETKVDKEDFYYNEEIEEIDYRKWD